jgi:hypothetical protein
MLMSLTSFNFLRQEVKPQKRHYLPDNLPAGHRKIILSLYDLCGHSSNSRGAHRRCREKADA